MGSGGGVFAVSAGMSGTRGSGVLSSTCGVLEMSVVRGVGGVCDLGLGFTNPVWTGGVLDECLCFGCGGVGGVGEEWVGGLGQGREQWGGVMSV